MQAAIIREPLLDLHPRNGPGLAPFRTLTKFMQVIYYFRYQKNSRIEKRMSVWGVSAYSLSKSCKGTQELNLSG